MFQVQHQSMMAMMGALDGTQPQVAMQQAMTNQQAARSSPPVRGENQDVEAERVFKGNNSIRGVLGELHNLQESEERQKKKGSARSPHGKENVDSPMRLSHLQSGENIEVYRVTHDDQGRQNFYPNFLRIPAERDSSDVRLPQIPRQAWTSQSNFVPPQNRGPVEMPLLHVDRTVPAHKFPATQRGVSIPHYLPEPGYFHPPQQAGPQHSLPRQPLLPKPSSHQSTESLDSGIGIPLLRLQTQEEQKGRAPRFGELLPPDQVIESIQETEQKDLLRERYMREFHQLQVGFGL